MVSNVGNSTQQLKLGKLRTLQASQLLASKKKKRYSQRYK